MAAQLFCACSIRPILAFSSRACPAGDGGQWDPAARLREQTASRAAAFSAIQGRRPRLDVIIVGNHPASRSYVMTKTKQAGATGIDGRLLDLPDSIESAALIAEIAGLNTNRDVDGILVQLPLPPHLNSTLILEAIDPAKDVDGFHPVNAGRLLTAECDPERTLIPCTPLGSLLMLWSRVGFVVKVEVMPAAIYFKRALAREFPVYMLGWGRTGKAEPSFLTEVLTTKDPKAGRGSYNASYSNPGFDVVVARGLEADGASERNGFFKEAMKVALDDVAYIPSHAQLYVIATKSNLSATPSALEMTPACTYTRRAN